MEEWLIALIVVGGVALGVALIHGIINYRRLRSQLGAVGREITSLSMAVWRQARKIVVLVIGFSVILVGVALIVLPGPAIVVIPLGIAILAVEFTWARRWLRHLRVSLHLSARRSKRLMRGLRATPDGETDVP